MARDFPWTRGFAGGTGGSAPGDTSRRSALFPRVRCVQSEPVSQNDHFFTKVSCPHCKASLKIWPVEAQSNFICQHPHHKKRAGKQKRSGLQSYPNFILSVYNCKVELSREIKQISREIKNLGGNQLHCYPCDYSSCLGCVSLSLSSQGSEAARIMATLNDNKPSHRKHSHRTKRVRNSS